jgi:hypothetical protein
VRAGALFRRAEPPPVPSPAVFAAIRERVLAPERRFALAPAWPKVAFAVASVLVTLEAGFAVVRYGPSLVRRVLPSAPTQAARGLGHRQSAATSSPVVPELPAAPAPSAPAVAASPLVISSSLSSPPPANPAARRAAPAPTLSPPVRASAPEPLSGGPLSREAAALAPAFEALNAQRDPESALRLLRGYRGSFPAGSLAPTAGLLELRAWLALGDERSALARLNDFAARDFEGVAGASELRVLHAELLLRGGRLDSAVSAFDRALARPLLPALRERALFGKASALEHRGDLASGQAVLKQYLSEFPDGRFAGEARLRAAP